MKTLVYFIKKASVCIFAALVSCSSLCYTQTYTTLVNGNWDDSIIVWSLDGLTPCGCRPGQDVDAFIVEVNHNILLTTYDVWIKNNGKLDISINGSLIDPGIIYSLYIENGVVTSYGIIDLKGTEIKPLGNFLMYGPTLFDNKFFLEGSATLDTSLIILNADIQIKLDGIMNFQGSPVVNMLNGDLVNEGTTNYTDTCTILTISNGNVNNVPTGAVNGNGAIRVSNGGITNTGSWSVNMQWCASGPGVGLPIPEDCGPTNCSSTPLPIELLIFGVTNTNGNQVNIEWITASEINNSHFDIERSTDVINWESIALIPGAGNSNVVNDYKYTDNLGLTGTYYYRLVQVDYNGDSEVLGIKTITYTGISSSLSINIYPNPVSDVLVMKLVGNNESEMKVEIVNFSGEVVLTRLISNIDSNEHRFDITGLSNGIFMLRISGANFQQSTKLVVYR